MEPITEDQELTLRRWVTAKGNGPPEESDKAFLVMEKGLSGEQIDFWFKKHKSTNRELNPRLPKFCKINCLL